ncbi:MAG TPA: peptidoglycan DD-metalloendopeptidase family protein [Candidatus Dormibacteraeota bacterium]|nr:peptidoglycan DD-metalloendopeptidase family protein [Candidatus Dormibacteraeota bacterium]
MRGWLLAVALSLVVLSLGTVSASADSSPSDPQQRLALIAQIRAQLGSNLADAMAAQQQLQQSLQDNAAQQQAMQAKITDVEEKIADLDAQIADAKRQEAILSERIEVERAQLTEIARAIYSAPQSPLVTLAEARSLSDLLTRISDLNVAADQATTLKTKMNNDLTELQVQRHREEYAREQEAEQRDLLNSQLAQLQALQAQEQSSMDQLQAKIAQTRWEIAVLDSQSTQLAQQITDMLQQQQDAIIAAAMQAVWTQLQLWSQSNSIGQIQLSSGHSTKYRFIWPEPQATITQPFGPSTYWFEPPYGSYPHFHTGIDMVEPFGSPVFAADDGVVALVGSTSSGYGTYVVIAHSGGLATLYGHLSAALVTAGQTVTQGTPVGLEGSTGNSTGPHLHFELRINQVPIDPTPYLPPGAPSPYKA